MRRAWWQDGERRLASGALALAVALAAIPGLGCEATTLTAQGAPVPVLIGPVACIGCAPASPVGPVLAPLEDRALARNMAGGANAVWEKSRPNFARKIADVVRDPCRIDVHVSRLHAGALGVFVSATTAALSSTSIR